ncbi:MAG: STAS domain-containing protein [Candidatus Xenobiia bacterium LiM19]
MFNYRFVEEEEGKVLILDLEGEFDTAGAQTVQDRLESYNVTAVEKIVFDLAKVTLMASSGLRVIFYAKDKMKSTMKVELKGAQGLVAKVIKMSGISKFVDVT